MKILKTQTCFKTNKITIQKNNELMLCYFNNNLAET